MKSDMDKARERLYREIADRLTGAEAVIAVEFALEQLSAQLEKAGQLVAALEHYADREIWSPSETVTEDMDDFQYERLIRDFYDGGGGHGFEIAQAALKAYQPDGADVKCKRCTVCEGQTHHWREGFKGEDPIWECAHCPHVLPYGDCTTHPDGCDCPDCQEPF